MRTYTPKPGEVTRAWLVIGSLGALLIAAAIAADPVVSGPARGWILAGLVLPAVVGGLATNSWWGVLLGFIWGGLVRLAMVHHITWSINSVCHIWGSRTYKSNDESRNNPIFGIMAFGEGWHNNHHAHPASVRHGLAWYENDINWIGIRALEKLGLATRLRLAGMPKRGESPDRDESLNEAA